MMSKNIDVNRSRDKDSDIVVEVIGNKKMTDNANPKNKGEKEKEKEKPKRKNVRRKPLKYAGKTDEEIRRIVQNQKNESGKLRVETEKYGLEEAQKIWAFAYYLDGLFKPSWECRNCVALDTHQYFEKKMAQESDSGHDNSG